MKVSISDGNSKMGRIKSVSQPPVKTCPHDAPCYLKCYARRLCARRKCVAKAYQNNYLIYKSDPEFYMKSVLEAAQTERFFRWHVGGDIVDRAYFNYMVQIAKELPKTQFLIFTKQYEIVNDYIKAHKQIPYNMHLIFSAWEGKRMENPFSIPVCRVLKKNEIPNPSWVLCSGNCTQCAVHDGGCWSLRPGETIAIYEH